MADPGAHSPPSPTPFRKKKLYERLNEIHFVESEEFRQMAPTIVQLEISRVSDLLQHLDPGSDVYTTLVAVRYRLNLFQEELEENRYDLEHLNAAIMSLVIPEEGVEESVRDTLEYIGDRLGYILAQLKRLR